MALSFKKKHNSEIKEKESKPNVQKITKYKTQKNYIKTKTPLVPGQHSNFNYYIPAMSRYYNDNYQIPESNNNHGIVAEWDQQTNAQSFYNHPIQLPVAFVSPQIRSQRHPYARPLITPDSVVSSVGQPVAVPEFAPNFSNHFYGYPFSHNVPNGQEPNRQEPYTRQPYYVQPPYAQQSYVQQSYVQQSYVQQSYVQPSYIQRLHVQQPHEQQPHVQELHVQQPHEQQPHVQQPHEQQPYMQQPHEQQPYMQQSYVQQAYKQEPSTQKPCKQEKYLKKPDVQEPSLQKPCPQKAFLKKPQVQKPRTQQPCMQEANVKNHHVEESSIQDTFMQEPRTTTADVINGLLEDSASPEQTTKTVFYNSKYLDPLEVYLRLPKDLFPSPKLLGLDPNPIIDQFCKIANVNDVALWVLDLELGVPIIPTTRSIAIYDIKYNSIQLKEDPDVIHPGFQKCNDEFKNHLISFYYDVVCSWYKGYTIIYNEKSFENFRQWLMLPMQTYGLCWP